MTQSELALVISWAAEEGWNPGLYDAECFYAADENGFLIGLLNGEPIASISAVKYSETFGFIGFYMVRPAFRGRGYGWRIWQAGLDYLQGRTIGLDGVVEQQENYLKSGFTLAHRNTRYEGVCTATNSDAFSQKIAEDNYQLVDLSSVSLKAVANYDRDIFLCDRSAFLNRWINSPHHQSVGLIQAQQLLGYGVLRPCQQGYKIGPLFANEPEAAELIFLALRSRVELNAPFYLDVPNANALAVALAKKYQMASVFETARMYAPKTLDLPLHHIFGITTFELG